jgi:hypothetical protein
MVQPNLLFPIYCHLQLLNRGETLYDEDLREPIQSESMDQTIILPGQVMWTGQGKLDETASGPTEQSDGYVIFKYVDLRMRSVELKREDRIIRLGFVVCDLYITGFQPIAHWPDLNGPGLLKAMFRDKQKSRNSPGV